MTRRYTKTEIDFIMNNKPTMSYAQLAAAIGSTASSVKHQWQYRRMMDDPIEREKYYIKRRERNPPAKPRRSRAYVKYEGLNYTIDRVVAIPDNVLADRDRRLCEPRTLSMEQFGDPPPSQSALGRFCP